MAEKKIALIDVEEGYRPVYKWIKEGRVELFECTSANEVEKVLVTIDKRADEFERIVIDSATHLSTITLNEIMLPSAGRLGKIWNAKAGLKGSWDDYGQVSSIVNMLIGSAQEMNRRGMEVVVLASEAVRESPGEGIEMHGPDLQKAIMKFAYNTADVVGRLAKITQPSKIGGETYTIGTRMLRIQDSAKYMAKGREDWELNVPELIPLPKGERGMPLVMKAFEVKPRKIVIYGPPGAGKTVLACS